MLHRLFLIWVLTSVGCAESDSKKPIEAPFSGETLKATVTTSDLPILRFKHAMGDDVLLGYKLTDVERTIFMEMDSATAKLPEETTTEQYHATIIPIGKNHGLTPSQSIAFWTRSTFSIFEE